MIAIEFLFFAGTPFCFRVFAELDKSAACGFGMKEGDVETFSTATRSFVDESASLGFHLVERVLNAVGYAEGHVLDAASAAVVGDELGDCAVFGSSLEELDFGLADFKESCAHFLVSNFFDSEAFNTKNVFIERDCFLKTGNRNADVFDMGDFHSFDKYVIIKLLLFY